MADHLPHSDLVVLAAPVEAVIGLLSDIAPHLKPGAVVTDVGSTKSAVIGTAKKNLPQNAFFIGGHPMAGAERSGVEAADPLLFNERFYLLCPCPDTPNEKLLEMIDVVEDLLAVPVTIEPEEHDRIMATISHIPQLLAIALMHSALEVDREHGMLEMVAGKGFLDLTRIAASDYSVWQGILDTNRAEIGQAFDVLSRSMDLVRAALDKGELGSLWEQVSRRRRMMTLDSLPKLRRPDMRKLIDRYDEQIIKALGNRMHIVKKLGRLKADREMPVHDPDRERRLLAKRVEWAQSLDLPPELVHKLFQAIMEYSRELQSNTGEPQGDHD